MTRQVRLVRRIFRPTMMNLRTTLCLLALAAAAVAVAQPIDPAKLNTMIEALTRLGPEAVNANPKLKEALGKVLAATRGTPQFVQLVEQFKLADQNAGLLEVSAKHPADEAGVTALRLVLASNGTAALSAALTGKDVSAATKLVEALGNTGAKQLPALLLPLVSDTTRDAALRKQSVRALARTQDGAAALLKLAREDKLPADLRFTATAELNAVRWPELKAEAAKLLPLPPGQGDKALPPVAELLAMKGDAKRGAEVFSRETVGCAKCHIVNGQGVDFGPALSEIGSKLPKDALLESILDPSAGISFGFEAWSVETKVGEEFFGLIVSETGEDVSVKTVGGAVTKVKKAELARRQQSKLSIMPAGLQQTITVQELADLLEYLATLKKK
ncbi:MAG: Heme-binding protein [Limisphaerales bacterium]|nr:MAG: Heme-binding protein [Limisphaerales bacterium]KAG0509128.1 MAG: Heme-binding protein [Limisphaerales bacterium]TXT50835.1 MAG: Heme-binding protein [Limisphaerales bacterium]